MMTFIPLSGDESDKDCKEIAWAMFCFAHPIEAHRQDPEKFWQFFHSQCPDVPREEMEAHLRNVESEFCPEQERAE